MRDMDPTLSPVGACTRRDRAVKEDSAAATEVFNAIFPDPFESVHEAEVAFLVIGNPDVVVAPFDAATDPVDTAHDSMMQNHASLRRPLMPSERLLRRKHLKNSTAGRTDNGHGWINHALAGGLVPPNQYTGAPQF